MRPRAEWSGSGSPQGARIINANQHGSTIVVRAGIRGRLRPIFVFLPHHPATVLFCLLFILSHPVSVTALPSFCVICDSLAITEKQPFITLHPAFVFLSVSFNHHARSLPEKNTVFPKPNHSCRGGSLLRSHAVVLVVKLLPRLLLCNWLRRKLR